MRERSLQLAKRSVPGCLTSDGKVDAFSMLKCAHAQIGQNIQSANK